ncbi:MAG TPA: hypothetical protein VKV17_00355 [Bryobacteraceae bacterium]|nr:hypothetical protein [Bryobacteraceae bacterium]
MLPQVLAGLGVSLASAACQLWLEHLQPLFLAVAIVSLGYQIWLVRIRPPARRKTGVKTVLAVSLLLNVIVVGGWIALLIRYR